MELLSKIKALLLEIIFPPVILPKDIKINGTLFCGKCHARLPENKKICHRDWPYRLGAVTGYDNQAVREMIWRLKYSKKSGYAEPLAGVLAQAVGKIDLNWQKFTIVPIPLSRERLASRGFNQSELLSEKLAEKIGLSVDRNLLIRIKNTRPQVELEDHEQRKNNVAGAFAATGDAEKKNYILIDDVSTSGATMLEAAKTLKKAGARNIVGFVIALARK